MNNARTRDIKRQQKESQLLRVISKLISQTTMDHPELLGLSLTRVELTPDKSNCFVFFWIPGGSEAFNEKLQILKLFKPSLRKALATEINSRYVPDIRFKYDALHEKLQHIEHLLDEVKTDTMDEPEEELQITADDINDDIDEGEEA